MATLDLAAAADRLGVHYQTAYRWVREGRLPAARVGKQYVLEQRDIDDFAEQRRARASIPQGSVRRNWERLADHVYDALMEGDERRVEEIVVRAHREGDAVIDILSQLFVPALVRVGEGWRAGEVTIAQEHRASLLLTKVLGAIDQRRRGRPRGRAVVAAPAGEHHLLPCAMAAAVLRADGWQVEILGADLPPDALRDFVESTAVDVVVLSCTNPAALDLATRAAAAVDSPDRRVLVGGPGRSLAELVELARG